MNPTRVKGLVLRHLIYWRRSLNRLTDTFWWPVVSLLVWGLFTVFASEKFPAVALWLIGALIFWVVIQRCQNEISVPFMDEVWSENLLNLFATPLTFGEFLLGLMIVSIIKLAFSLATIIIAALILYHYNLFSIGLYVVPFIGTLIIFGWTIGIFINSAILRFGRDSEALAWTAIIAVQPFSCVFYPLSILPPLAQAVAVLLPSTYIFEGFRSLLYTGYLPNFYLFMAIFLSLIYFVVSFFVFRQTLIHSKEAGLLARLLD